MDPTNFLKWLGFENATPLLDPAFYPKADLEDDLLTIQLDREHAKSMAEQKGEEYDAKLDEAAEAPEWMEDDLLLEADEIEVEQEDWRDEWRELGEWKRLLKAIKSFRRRINAQERDLSVSELLNGTNREEVRSELRAALKSHMRSDDLVQNLLQEFTNARSKTRSQSQNKRNLSEHRDRMEERKKGRSDSGTDGNRDADDDDERSATAISDDD